MKNSKFWVWFIPLFIIMCISVYLLVDKASRIEKPQETGLVNTDNKKIKEEYEKLNNEYLKVNLSDNSAYVYASEDDIKNIKDAIIYFGEVSSFSSRKTISLFDNVISSTSIEKVYYVNIANLSDDFKSYLLGKLNVKEIYPGDIYTFKDSKVLNNISAVDYDNDKVLSESEKEELMLKYKELIQEFIDSCTDKC